MHVCPHPFRWLPALRLCSANCLTWSGRIYLGSGGEAAVLQLKKKKNKTKIQRNRRKQCKEANSLHPPADPARRLSVRRLGEAAAEAKFQFRGYCIFSQPFAPTELYPVHGWLHVMGLFSLKAKDLIVYPGLVKVYICYIHIFCTVINSWVDVVLSICSSTCLPSVWTSISQRS